MATSREVQACRMKTIYTMRMTGGIIRMDTTRTSFARSARRDTPPESRQRAAEFAAITAATFGATRSRPLAGLPVH